jgi:signal transduction histidine kinase
VVADAAHPRAEGDDLLAVIAHSLLGSVSVIVGGSELLSTHWEDLPEERRTELLVSIRNQGRHVAAVLDNLIRLGDPGLIEALDGLQHDVDAGAPEDERDLV